MADKNYDILIIGGGPAGLACGQYSARAGLKTAILEEMAPGGQAMIIDEIENYPGLGKISGYELAAKFEEQATAFGCEIQFATVESIDKDGKLFNVKTSDGLYTSYAVVIATGAKHRNLNIPGEKELTGHGVSYCATCDGPFFRGKKILVCGGGDSACQEAIYLSKLSDNVTICHRRDKFRAQEAIVRTMEKANVKKKMSTIVKSINAKDDKVSSVTFHDNIKNQDYEEDFDGVFIFVGMNPISDLAKDCEKTAEGYIYTDLNMMTSVEGMYAIGDVRETPFRQIVTAAADGAIAAHYASEYIDSIKSN